MQDDKLIQLGAKVHKLRQNRKLTLDSLSKLAGVSKAMLSQIEQDKVNPTVAVMMKIASALQVSISELLDQPAKQGIMRVIRNDDPEYTYRSDKYCNIRTLSPLSLEKSIEFYNVSIEPNGVIKSEPHFPGTEEILHVTHGKVCVTSGNESIELNRGDSAHYRADTEHCITNISRSRSEFFLVVKYQDASA